MTNTGQEFFLTSSLRGYPWRERLDPGGINQAARIAQSYGISDLLARIMAGRGIKFEAVEAYLEPRLRDLMPDPSTLQDMQASTKRLQSAIAAKEKVVIFGDYDVDGACASALLAEYLHHFGLTADIYIPDRLIEGYGPNVEAIEGFAEDGYDLLVCVDCGSTSFEPLQRAAGLGLRSIIIDHHLVGELLPPHQALVNPNRQDDLSGLGHLCAAGVVFMVLVALNRALRDENSAAALPDLMAGLDLVAMATVCDVVPLIGLNRAFVTQGLKVAQSHRRIGLKSLMEVSRLNRTLEASHFGFMLGPRINAGGRVGDASLGAKLMLCQSHTEAYELARSLDTHNRERQVIEQSAIEEAMRTAEDKLNANPDLAVLCLASNDWHPGIIGLVAARLRERFNLPAFAITWRGDGTGTGSGRSISGVDLGVLVHRAVDEALLVKGGGHAMAAGITLEQARFAELEAFFQQEAKAEVEKAVLSKAREYDAVLSASGIDEALIRSVQAAEPFGRGNEEPCILLSHHRVLYAETVGSNHLRLSLGDQAGGKIDAIAFRAMDSDLGPKLLQRRGQAIHALGLPFIDEWQGRRRLRFRLTDAALADD